MKPFVVLEKNIGETPLQCVEAWRQTQPALADVPLAYAGRLDPMASGALLVLIGDECKRQTEYHSLDKIYTFTVLFGVSSDSGDVLGIPEHTQPTHRTRAQISAVLPTLTGEVTLPYPQYSSKTVAGKPLHTWTLEGRLDEITIPTKTSTVHSLTLQECTEISAQDCYAYIQSKIETILPVTEASKALGNDFRRPLIRTAWHNWYQNHQSDSFTLATFRCTASSGTYMRTLASMLGKELGVPALAYHIHRDQLGSYRPLIGSFGVWTTRYRSIPRAF